jgi:flavin-dependent dehydrogenase
MKHDVIVVGAGPAGSVAGSILSRAGLKVLCLEAGTFPRFQIGESLLPRCNDILEDAGLLEAVTARGFMHKPAAVFWRGDETERYSFAEMFPGQRPSALQVVRADFDQCLATQARRHGVDVRFQQRVDAVEFEGGAKVSCTDLETGAKYTVEGKFLIDCSGYGRVLPKLLQLESTPSLGPRCAVFSHFEGDDRPQGPPAGDIWICIHPEGPWAWIIPFSNGRTSVGMVGDRALIESKGSNDHDRLLALMQSDPNVAKRFRHGVPVMKTQRLEGWSASVSKFCGPHWAVTGNASEFLDPIFSSGVTLALESASRAAKLVVKQLGGQNADWEKDYSEVMRKAVGVFKVFVMTWYEGILPEIFLAKDKPDSIKRAITSVLGGYVLDPQNPFVRDARGTLATLQKLI